MTKKTSDYLNFAIQTALNAGNLIREARSQIKLLAVVDQDNKGLITDADLKSDEYILHAIRSIYPTHAILTEESGQNGESDYEWIVDPIDGTNNFRRGDPHFSISIGLRKQNFGIVGVVYAPALDVLYYATDGGGAFMKQHGKIRQLHVSGKDSLKMFTMSFATGIDFQDPKTSDQIVAAIRDSGLFTNFRRRMLESTALELCYVAEGRFDAHFNNSAKPWDIAAGEVVVREAEGVADNLANEKILASNGVIHQKLIEVIKPFV